MSSRRLHGGYFYPLDVKRALDLATGEAYVRRCVERAQRAPDSDRRRRARSALRHHYPASQAARGGARG